MKFIIISFLSLIADVSAFTTAFITTTITRPPNSCCKGLSVTTSQSRFDNLKSRWKGICFEHDTGEEDINFSYEEFGSTVTQSHSATYFNRNDIVRGTAIQYETRGCLVDIGAKASAFLPIKEASLIQEEGSTIESLIELNSERDFQIISNEDENGQLLVSVRRIQYREAWQRLIVRKRQNNTFEAECIAVNRGGAICLVEGLRAFLPRSHLNGRNLNEELIGDVFTLKFIDVDQETNKLIVSHRRAVFEQQMASLTCGDIIEGEVKAIKKYGAFIQVGRMSGLLHLSQISSDLVTNIDDVVQTGQMVKCMIIEIDELNRRIALSTKTLEPEPGMMITNPQKVYDMAEDMGSIYLEQKRKEREQRELKRKERDLRDTTKKEWEQDCSAKDVVGLESSTEDSLVKKMEFEGVDKSGSSDVNVILSYKNDIGVDLDISMSGSDYRRNHECEIRNKKEEEVHDTNDDYLKS